jgi:CspA family cold shock protein
MIDYNTMSSTDAVTSSTASDVLTGRVKWFNNKAGYGFITVTRGTNVGSDVFVHHSGINVENQQYKYLVQGEYVDFVLDKTQTGSHEFQASQVIGVNGGKLMCETRREFKLARNAYKTTKPESSSEVAEPATPRPSIKSRGQGPRESVDAAAEWTPVSVKKPAAKRGRPAATKTA